MRLIRLLPVAALVAAPLLSHPASAEPCNLTTGLPAHGAVIVCVNSNGCFLYENSGSDIHIQKPVCVPAPASGATP
jgi:hypothetical protein